MHKPTTAYSLLLLLTALMGGCAQSPYYRAGPPPVIHDEIFYDDSIEVISQQEYETGLPPETVILHGSERPVTAYIEDDAYYNEPENHPAARPQSRLTDGGQLEPELTEKLLAKGYQQTVRTAHKTKPKKKKILTEHKTITKKVYPVIKPTSGDMLSDGSDIWVRLRKGFSIPRDNPNITSWAWRFSSEPTQLYRILKRAEPVLWHLTEIIEQRGMPSELALLPAVESGFDPFAYSRSHAAGLWQFLPATGTRFNLDQNWWYDGRRDILLSTHAAMEYMEYLHGYFDDWLLAIGAYNCGEGGMQKALERGKRGSNSTFWEAKLPKQTREYVPKLLGLIELIAHPEKYDFELPVISDIPQLEVVRLPQQTDLSIASQMIGLNTSTLHRYNPGFKRWATPPEGPFELLVPLGKGPVLQQALRERPKDTLVSWRHHKVVRGENLSQIAAYYGASTASVRNANSLRGDLIKQGDMLLIPAGPVNADGPANSIDKGTQIALAAKNNKAGMVTHRVSPGETLSHIAHKFRVSIKQLMDWNALSSSALRAGQTLRIMH